MIFKRLFTPKHQHADAQVRLSSIANLDKNKVSDKQALHELAFNDSNADVSLAALAALNSFPLWVKTAQIASNVKLKKHAQHWVLETLKEPQSSALSEHEFVDFIRQSNDKVLLEQLLFGSVRLQQHKELAVNILLQLDKPNNIRLFYKDIADEQQQSLIVEHTDTLAQLTKLLKVTVSDTLKNAIEQKIQDLKLGETLPLQIQQKVTLILSKLLACKDTQDYQKLLEDKQALLAEFNLLKPDFGYLSEEDSLAFAAKFLHLSEAVDKKLESLKGAWESANELRVTTDMLADAQQRYNDVASQVRSIEKALDDPSIETQAKLLKHAIEDIQNDLVAIALRPQTAAHKQLLKTLHKCMHADVALLAHLPLVQVANTQAKGVLQKLSALISEQQALLEQHSLTWEFDQSTYDDLLVEFGAANENVRVSAHIQSEYEQCQTQVRQLKNKAKNARKEQEKRCQGKLKAVQGMVNAGRFKPAIATFEKARSMYVALDHKAQASLASLFTDVLASVDELKDLQAYIAAPRKPALLEQAIGLAQPTNGDDINALSHSIKQLRGEWNSLGKLNTPEDDALNEAFDSAIETAFAPCRAFFAEQEAQRANNLDKAYALIQVLKDLAQADDAGSDDAGLQKQLSTIAREYKALGAVEHAKRKSVHNDYRKALKPLQARVEAFQAENALQKQSLVNKALKLADLEADDAAQQAKTLQQQWKQIGFAGKSDEDSLWRAFRSANDAVFSKVKALKEQDQQALTQAQEIVRGKLDALQTQVSLADDVKSLTANDEVINEAQTLVNTLPPRQQKRYQQDLETLIQQQQDKFKALEHDQQRQQWVDLFDVLAQWTSTSVPDAAQALANKWQNALKASSSEARSRHELTIQAELIAEQSSPKQDQEKRKLLQLEMMAHRLEGNQVPSLEDILLQWISLGHMSHSDTELLTRMRSLFSA